MTLSKKVACICVVESSWIKKFAAIIKVAGVNLNQVTRLVFGYAAPQEEVPAVDGLPVVVDML